MTGNRGGPMTVARTRSDRSHARGERHYDPPPVDRSSVLGEDGHHGGFSESTTAVADFTALTSGTATGTSQTDVGCLHSTPRCLPPQRGFTLAVMVG